MNFIIEQVNILLTNDGETMLYVNFVNEICKNDYSFSLIEFYVKQIKKYKYIDENIICILDTYLIVRNIDVIRIIIKYFNTLVIKRIKKLLLGFINTTNYENLKSHYILNKDTIKEKYPIIFITLSEIIPV